MTEPDEVADASEVVVEGLVQRVVFRAVDAKEELDYLPVKGAARHGRRPPKLNPRSARRTAG